MQDSMTDVKEPIRRFILEYAANVIDSLGAFRLIGFLEDTFPLTVEDSDMVPENFQSLNDIESFVIRKLRG